MQHCVCEYIYLYIYTNTHNLHAFICDLAHSYNTYVCKYYICMHTHSVQTCILCIHIHIIHAYIIIICRFAYI